MGRRIPERRVTPTLDMVAMRAGVSRATVSRVINNLDRVAPATAAAVAAAVDELGYVPNRAARSLVRQSANTVAILIPEAPGAKGFNPYLGAVVQGVTETFSETDETVSLVLASGRHHEKCARFLGSADVAGAILVAQHEDDTYDVLERLRIPYVGSEPPVNADVRHGHFVHMDGRAAARSAVEHLVARGRTRIAMISGPQNLVIARERVQGWRDALRDARLPDTMLVEGDFGPRSGAEAIATLIREGSAFDAVFSANDQMAYGAIAGLQREGKSVPDDVAVVGFDDDPTIPLATPAITTVRQPIFGLGETMSVILQRLIAGDDVERITVVPTELVVRDSA